MSEHIVGRHIKISGHQYYTEGKLLAIGGLSEHGWFLVEYADGRTHKYDMQYHYFDFVEPVKSEALIPQKDKS